MALPARLALAAAIVVVDLVVFAVPLAALAMAYVIVVRPARFLDWVLRIYGDQATPPGSGS